MFKTMSKTKVKTMCKTVFKTMFITMFELMFKTVFKIMFKIIFKTMFVTMFKTVFEKKDIANKNMSFLKITDPKKRDFIVNECRKTRQNIQQNFLPERVGDVNTQYKLSKHFKPVTDMHSDVKECILSKIKPIREGMKNLPKAVTFPQFPSITAYDDDDGEEVDVFIGDIAEQYLQKFALASDTDKAFGLRNKDGKFYIGNKEAKIKENNIIVGDREYADTPGLWKLIVATTLDDKIFTNGDYDSYAEIMLSTNALRRNESETKPKDNKSWKLKHILKPIWDEKDHYTGNGLTPSVPTPILPCDPITLVEIFDILMASKASGNTEIRNELVSVCAELLRQNLIGKHK